ncbi:purine and uridine phosphorylase [Aspergillus homomorphus CBS 101889]|uniref:Purine and uridine phosphorylase n=1 Tax=Aspergillus homomorphus (strain CBS 101889) TaxID=1450537 RepID=A0A395I009_ASPHC|nr:purine and uridine phosphorylase [Aspergillus homomorphus CBS 101889]RAL13390.1 purine and uridine phosphorylase [Aspergillus homomorphus CBS 101889]
MAASPSNLCHHDYTIGLISALPLEMAAVTAMLDERHPDLPTKPNDDNAYVLGRINAQHVVLASATIANQIRLTFPSIRIGLMVRIGGGVPETREDIRLGDIVVSKPSRDHGGIVQYDYGKSLADGVFSRQGVLNKPPPIFLTAISRLQATHFTRASQIPCLTSELASTSCLAYPGADFDILFDFEYDHKSPLAICKDCAPGRRVKRSLRVSQDPVIHYGLIASANQVIKDGRMRDKLAEELGFLCFEVEAAGLMDSFPCLVFRRICDYSDSHKSKEWQGYAAATAAAYAKELLSVIHAKQVEDEPLKLFARDPELLDRSSSYRHQRVHRRLAHKRLAGTTQWFLKSPEFKEWSERRFNKLWCSGKSKLNPRKDW